MEKTYIISCAIEPDDYVIEAESEEEAIETAIEIFNQNLEWYDTKIKIKNIS